MWVRHPGPFRVEVGVNWILLKRNPYFRKSWGFSFFLTRIFDIFRLYSILNYQIVTQFFHEVRSLGTFFSHRRSRPFQTWPPFSLRRLEDGEKGGRSGQAEKLIICGNERGRRGRGQGIQIWIGMGWDGMGWDVCKLIRLLRKGHGSDFPVYVKRWILKGRIMTDPRIYCTRK